MQARGVLYRPIKNIMIQAFCFRILAGRIARWVKALDLQAERNWVRSLP
jgi:hypothetical protein